MSEVEYWIADPIGHRRHAQQLPIEVPPGFEDFVIDMAVMAGDEFICDMCNSVMPTKHTVLNLDDMECICGRMFCEKTGEPIPVPCSGSYALCENCFQEAGPENWQPPRGCACPPCVEQSEKWFGPQEVGTG